MTMKRLRRLLVSVSVAALAAAGAASGQSYGLGDQGIVIGAAAFGGQNLGLQGSLGSDGYLYQPNFLSTFSAPVSLPNGAAITQICIYSTNFKPGATLQLQLEAVKFGTPSAPGAVYPVAGASVTANSANGYDFACSGPISYTFHDVADLDGDQIPDRIAHRVSVAFTPLDDTLGLGGVRILWHRQISPPPATPTFGDVPPSAAFFPHVEALAASFITGGCSGGNYCPNSPLTRAQMATFLAKALGLHWPQ
jgi:hypothetical protein